MMLLILTNFGRLINKPLFPLNQRLIFLFFGGLVIY